MNERLPQRGDTIIDEEGGEHTAICCVPGTPCPWVKVATVGDLGHFMQLPLDEVTVIRYVEEVA